MGAGKKGSWSMVVMGVLILGLVLQAEGRSCGHSQCYYRCTKGRSKEDCAQRCDCDPIDVAEHNHFRNSVLAGERNAVGLCSSGCSSSICGIVNTVDGSEEAKRAAMGRCAEACTLFCSNGHSGSGIASTSA